MRIFTFLSALLLAVSAEAKITILTCEPEWQSLAHEIVGDKAEVFSVTLANQDPAKVSVSQGLAASFRRADMVFCAGGGLEDKWLKGAINKGDNLQVLTKQENLLLAADYALKKRAAGNNGAISRIHLNPYNIDKIAAEFTRRIKIIDAVNAGFYQKSYETFSTRWNESVRLWEIAAQPLKGMKVVVTDDAWLELTEWLGLEVVAKIEPEKSYIKNNQRLNEVARELKQTPVKVIIFAAYENKKPIMWLSQKTNTRLVLLPFTVGGAANSQNLFSMFATTINLLLADCSKVSCPNIPIN